MPNIKKVKFNGIRIMVTKRNPEDSSFNKDIIVFSSFRDCDNVSISEKEFERRCMVAKEILEFGREYR